MGLVLTLRATGVPVMLLAEAASWRLGDLRNRVLDMKESVDALYVIDASHALPTPQLEDRLNYYNDLSEGEKENIRQEIIGYSVKRAIWIYCGFWQIDKIRFVDNDDQIEETGAIPIDYGKEISVIMENSGKIYKEMTASESRRRDFGKVLSAVVSPEFDRIDTKLSDISRDTKALRVDSEALRADTNAIRTTQSEDSAVLRRLAAQLGVIIPGP